MTKPLYIAETICDETTEAEGHGDNPERALLAMLRDAIDNAEYGMMPADYLQECADIMKHLQEEGIDDNEQEWTCGDFSSDFYKIRIRNAS